MVTRQERVDEMTTKISVQTVGSGFIDHGPQVPFARVSA
jgi:hypothetical protein